MSYFVSKRKSFFLVEIAGFETASRADLFVPYYFLLVPFRYLQLYAVDYCT
jgi:hypothetical protein